MRRRDWVQTDGAVGSVIVSDGKHGKSYSVVFTYKVDGHYYGGTFTSYSETYREGDWISVKYDPSNPERNDLVLKETIKHWIIGAVVVAVVIGFIVAQFMN